MKNELTYIPPTPLSITEKQPFTNELEKLLNKHSIDNDLNTPDFILADMVVQMLEAIRTAQVKTNSWRTPPSQELLSNQIPKNA